MPRTIALVTALALLAPACAHSAASDDGYPDRVRFETSGGEVVLHVAIARTQAEKRRGLMHVGSLPQNAGMAFVWSEPTESGFWMKDTLIPLAIAFVSRDGRIAAIEEMEPCRTDPCPIYTSDEPYVFAVEANAGWFDRHGIREGDRAELEASS